MTSYDMAFSLGFSCGTSFALREAELQHESYPLDWIGTPGLLASVRMIASDFVGWFEKEDLRLFDVRRGALNRHVYINEKTGFGFAHDFSSFVSFDEAYPSARAKYERRVIRFLRQASRTNRILAVYTEYPTRDKRSLADLREARRILSERFPQAKLDVLYFYEVEGRLSPLAEEPEVGIVTVGIDYREVERGAVMHTVDHGLIAQYLRAHVAVADLRSDEEKKAYAKRKSVERKGKWGDGSPLTRLVNRIAYRLYRKLEKRLVDQGMLPWEGPLWFERKDQ